MRSNALLGVAAVAASVGIFIRAAPPGGEGASGAARTAPEFQGIDQWLNSPPLTLQDLRGKAVLVDFWSCTCINCLDHLPHVKEWNSRYKKMGLAVVGVHTPELACGQAAKNVQEAVDRLQIEHPVALDNRCATWKAFDGRCRPSVHLIDPQGKIVYSHFGDGSYGAIEQKIRALLAGQAPAASV
jgi:thiol-disulfide isomerase/thioredoxin